MDEKINLRMLLGQVLFYSLLMAFIGYLADSPDFEYTPETHGDLKLIVRHSGELLGECVKPDPEEQKKLPPNMRAPMICPRERSPVSVRMSLDDRLVLDKILMPAGLHNDGISAEYRNFPVQAGRVRVQLVINDNQGSQDATHTFDQDISIDPGESVALEFSNGFTLYQKGSNLADANDTPG